MSNPHTFAERLQGVFTPTPRGVVGLVYDLLGLCREQGLQLDWNANRCRVQLLGTSPQESIEVPLQKSVFRAMLARVAALCNERIPDSVSPYGGEGKLAVGISPLTVVHVAFTNSAGEQSLEVKCLGDDSKNSEPGNGQTRSSRCAPDTAEIANPGR